MIDFSGKVAVVSGAGKNIGREIALQFAHSGASVVVNGRSDEAAVKAVADEIATADGQSLPYVADVSDPHAVAGMIDATMNTFGRIDFVVSNAGLRRQTPFLEMDFDEWREILSVALDGAFVLARAAVPHIVSHGDGGSVVTMSGVSNRLGTRDRVHVCASKAGLEGFTRGLAMELAEHGITVNSISPGAIDTVRGASAGTIPSSLGDSGIPLGRRGRSDEIAAMVMHLCSPAGAYITGQTIQINGGVYLT